MSTGGYYLTPTNYAYIDAQLALIHLLVQVYTKFFPHFAITGHIHRGTGRDLSAAGDTV